MSTPADFRSIVDLQQAGQLAAAGRPQEALPCLEAAVRLEPGTPQPLCLLGALCHTLGRLEQAAASYRQAVGIAPRLARAYNNLALVLKEQGDPDGAVAVLRSVLSFMPDYATALNNLGSVLADAGRDSEALAAFGAAAARALARRHRARTRGLPSRTGRARGRMRPPARWAARASAGATRVGEFPAGLPGQDDRELR
jgi:Flp pilus assembly protein TadD